MGHWSGSYGVVNSIMLRTKRITAHSWEAFVDDESVGCHPTRREARAFAEKVATDDWGDPDDDGSDPQGGMSYYRPRS